MYSARTDPDLIRVLEDKMSPWVRFDNALKFENVPEFELLRTLSTIDSAQSQKLPVLNILAGGFAQDSIPVEHVDVAHAAICVQLHLEDYDTLQLSLDA